MALGTEPYRHLYAADLTALRDLSVMAERVYVHLACGERSSACCMASCDPEHLRYSVRARRTAEVLDALAELEAAGWLVLDLSCKQAWLPVQAKRTWIVSESSATGWRNDLSRFKVSVATRQALAFIDSAPVPPPKGQAPTPDLRSRNSSSNRNSIPTVAKATVPPPFGDDVPAVSNFPDPWAKLAEQYADPLAAERYIPKGPSLTPTAALRLAQADARKAGILLPEPEPQQLVMDLPAGKPTKRSMTDSQLDAIFAQKQLAIAVDIWNEELGSKTCGPCSLKDVRKMATQLMSNLAKYTNSGGESPAKLMGWAAVRSDFHSGKALGVRTWTFQKWMTAEHLASVYADYRKDRGEGRPIMYQHERTLRDWRIEVEAAELNKKLAAVNNEAA